MDLIKQVHKILVLI
jgi:hypothetical protein